MIVPNWLLPMLVLLAICSWLNFFLVMREQSMQEKVLWLIASGLFSLFVAALSGI